jgi:Tfp pilus assembly protein FimV
VTLSPDLNKLSHAEKDVLIQALTEHFVTAQERIAARDARIAALEAWLDALTRPPKTPDNSSKPPSQGQKQNRPASKSRPRGRPEVAFEPGSCGRCQADGLSEVPGCLPGGARWVDSISRAG